MTFPVFHGTNTEVRSKLLEARLTVRCAPVYLSGMVNLILERVRVIDPAEGRDETADLVLRDGILQGGAATTEGLRRIRAEGWIAAPGFWDVHVHFREPGNTQAETRRSGAGAAAAGGFTHVVTMPNTSPAGDSAVWVQEQAADDVPVRILPAACVTRGRQGRDLAELEALAQAGAVAFTDDGAMVADEDVMRCAMTRARALNRPVMDHAVVPSIAGKGVVRDCPLARANGWPIFPAEAEVEAVRRDIRLCRETGCATHIQHVSCAESVAAIRVARAEGLPVTAEVTPHHLALAAEDIPSDDGHFRMNPPLGTRKDARALREAVLDGTLGLFATDHAPHTPETKTHGFLRAAFGVIGLETAIGVTWRILVEEEGMTPLDWVARWSCGPAALLRQPVPALRPGLPVDLVLIDPATPWIVNPETFRSRSRNTPFAGWNLHARARLTVCGGRATYSDLP
ncbi:MAG TPA: dihydroorotase [Kiritimatiellia bacterium]|jgi:dihydroorotase|nr:dihydroorotase [Kiritimatiellia bacterium]HOR97023.1 dihydroorotase [Kiritimatiellia bacterium]HPC49450.1 dihydroorotase [Kiritimatiellia bacterium]HPK37103.1 dihydroorotase [Kiritimatiellia bacterium]HPW75413.1 dihydroorotase [Kiritimatiellia bacterium]